MKILGFEITRTKAAPIPLQPAFQPGWFPIIREPYTGAWQRNQEVGNDAHITAFHAVFACVTLIASDISKLWIDTIRLKDGVWTTDPKGSPKTAVLDLPNRMQTNIQFWESWILSKLLRGNTYVLKGRDSRGVVNEMHVLDPSRVTPMVADNGEVFYDLARDNTAGLQTERTAVPASEIIHDRFNTLFHPLVGVSPLWSAGLTATQGLTIQREAIRFFENRAIPGGILTAPSKIPEPTVNHLRQQWEENFGGRNSGKIAILGDGMKFEAMAITAQAAQMVEQSKATAEWICSAFHVPPYKIGIGPTPAYNNIQALNVEYYSQCLQKLIEDAERCLWQGLDLGNGLGVQFDEDGLLRMDTISQVQSIKEAVGAGIMSPNEGRAKLGMAPKPGCDELMMQEQNWPVSILSARKIADDMQPAAQPEPSPPEDDPDDDDEGGPENRAAITASLGQAIVKRASRLAA